MSLVRSDEEELVRSSMAPGRINIGEKVVGGMRGHLRRPVL
jgi:hypothetical protein